MFTLICLSHPSIRVVWVCPRDSRRRPREGGDMQKYIFKNLFPFFWANTGFSQFLVSDSITWHGCTTSRSSPMSSFIGNTTDVPLYPFFPPCPRPPLITMDRLSVSRSLFSFPFCFLFHIQIECSLLSHEHGTHSRAQNWCRKIPPKDVTYWGLLRRIHLTYRCSESPLWCR